MKDCEYKGEHPKVEGRFPVKGLQGSKKLCLMEHPLLGLRC